MNIVIVFEIDELLHLSGDIMFRGPEFHQSLLRSLFSVYHQHEVRRFREQHVQNKQDRAAAKADVAKETPAQVHAEDCLKISVAESTRTPI